MATTIVADLDQRALSDLLQFVEPQRHTYKRCMSLVCSWITGCSHGDGALLSRTGAELRQISEYWVICDLGL